MEKKYSMSELGPVIEEVIRFNGKIRLTVTGMSMYPLMRNRLKVEYTIPKSPFSLHVAAEPYWLKSITKARYYAGMGLQIHKNISMTTEYVRYEYYNSSADQNVVSIVLYVRI